MNLWENFSPLASKLRKDKEPTDGQVSSGSVWVSHIACDNTNLYPIWKTLSFPSFTSKLPDQSPSNFAQTSTPTQGRFLTQVWPCQPNLLTPGYPKLQNHSRSQEKKLCFIKNVQMGWLIFSVQRWAPVG